MNRNIRALLAALLLLSTAARDEAAPPVAGQKATSLPALLKEVNLASREHRFQDVINGATAALRYTISPNLAAQFHLARSAAYWELGDVRRTRADLDAALGLEPTFEEALRDRALISLLEENWAAAVADLTTLINNANGKPEIFQLRGYARAKLGQKELARHDYEEATKASAWEFVEHAGRAEAFQALGQQDRADEEIEACRRLHERDNLRALAWLEATAPSGRYRDGRAALRDATQACEMTHWKDTNALDTLAAAYAQAGDFPHAIEREKQAVGKELHPTVRKSYLEHLRTLENGKPIRDDGL